MDSETFLPSGNIELIFSDTVTEKGFYIKESDMISIKETLSKVQIKLEDIDSSFLNYHLYIDFLKIVDSVNSNKINNYVLVCNCLN